MMESIGLDGLILGVSVCSGLIGMALAGFMLVRSQPERARADVGDIVKNAPYGRLHNILKIKSPTDQA